MPGDDDTPRPDAPGSPWRTHTSRQVYRNPWITVTEHQVTRPDGQPGMYGLVDPGDNVTIAAVTESGSVWQIEDFIYAIQRRAWQLPSGAVEPGEEPLAAARRELLEETGLTAASWEKLGAFYLSPGILTQRSYLFLARHLTVGHARREHTEVAMIARQFPMEDAYAACLHESEDSAAAAVTALGLWLARARLAGESRGGMPP
ncbi:MAG TPA: NUDIX hydrolase [Ktedonobacterales bacterium]